MEWSSSEEKKNLLLQYLLEKIGFLSFQPYDVLLLFEGLIRNKYGKQK